MERLETLGVNAVKRFGQGNVAGFVRNRCLSATTSLPAVSDETSNLKGFLDSCSWMPHENASQRCLVVQTTSGDILIAPSSLPRRSKLLCRYRTIAVCVSTIGQLNDHRFPFIYR